MIQSPHESGRVFLQREGLNLSRGALFAATASPEIKLKFNVTKMQSAASWLLLIFCLSLLTCQWYLLVSIQTQVDDYDDDERAVPVEALHQRQYSFAELTRIGAIGPNIVCLEKNCRNRIKLGCDDTRMPPFSHRQKDQDSVCIIIRTYAKHMTDEFFSLKKLLLSLQSLQNGDWSAFILNTDSEPLVGIDALLASLDDKRIHVLNLISTAYDRYQAAYPQTDEAIQSCPRSTQWLLITNGDNFYEPSFLNHIDSSYDIIATDFYTRHNHVYESDIYGDGCQRFQHGTCKRNTMRAYHTDLGANLLSLSRWQSEDVKFSIMHPDGSQDSQTIDNLVYFGWKVKHVYECLFSHNPNPTSCSSSGGVWLSSTGRCINAGEAQIYLQSGAMKREHNVWFACLDKNE